METKALQKSLFVQTALMIIVALGGLGLAVFLLLNRSELSPRFLYYVFQFIAFCAASVGTAMFLFKIVRLRIGWIITINVAELVILDAVLVFLSFYTSFSPELLIPSLIRRAVLEYTVLAIIALAAAVIVTAKTSKPRKIID